jgi:hypothetical protein
LLCFFYEVITKKISETRDKDTIVAVLPIPVDTDTWPENRLIRYKLVQTTDKENTFRLNETSGEIVLLKELDFDHQRAYQFLIKATSRGNNWSLNQPIDFTDRTLLNVTLNVVRDKLLVEFIDDLHYVNVNLERDSLYQNRSVFYSKAYLVNRKLLNEVRFRIDGVEVKKPNSLVRVKPGVVDKVMRIDRMDGRVYINRSELVDAGFTVEDRLRVRIVANLYALTGAPLSNTDHEIDKYLIDNSMTRLEIKLTNLNASILMVLNNLDMKEIQLSYLNPNDARYISRGFGPIGFRPVVQDIIEPVINAHTLRTQPFNLLMQFSNLSDVDNMNNFNSNQFLAVLKKNSLRLSNSFDDKNIEFKAAMKSGNRQEGNDFYDLFDLTRPFYMSWMFWMLALIGMLLFVIMVMFVFCIKLNAKQARSGYNKNGSRKKSSSGLIIEYPPGVNPIFEDGVLKLE